MSVLQNEIQPLLTLIISATRSGLIVPFAVNKLIGFFRQAIPKLLCLILAIKGTLLNLLFTLTDEQTPPLLPPFYDASR